MFDRSPPRHKVHQDLKLPERCVLNEEESKPRLEVNFETHPAGHTIGKPILHGLGSSNSCKASRSRMINHCTTITIKLKWYLDKFLWPTNQTSNNCSLYRCFLVQRCQTAVDNLGSGQFDRRHGPMVPKFSQKISMLMLTALCYTIDGRNKAN